MASLMGPAPLGVLGTAGDETMVFRLGGSFWGLSSRSATEERLGSSGLGWGGWGERNRGGQWMGKGRDHAKTTGGIEASFCPQGPLCNFCSPWRCSPNAQSGEP